ncbi:MAG: sigma-54-dependent Fis family transcriptional regulator, partial [Candidatus Rokubacteria bacterium]|nr:sigma-54-dependent Fis family transcriptional regulator [Candidatus Rokubacteria bacterium]
DVRIVAATNAPLEALVAGGFFRLDLYHRLAEMLVELPPLRERREDVPFLAERFLEEARLELRRCGELEDGALAVLRAHDWHGNARELRNVVRRAFLLAPGTQITADVVAMLLRAGPGHCHSPASIATGGRTLKEIAHEAERAAIVEALARCHGNKSEVARQLGCDWKTLAAKCRTYGLGARETRTEVHHAGALEAGTP